ncbi:MAG: hypothetical protein LBR80_04080 [Deltaproteobacteria bacterium]|nr:hypothetical protein [Deltaproteobacteria bacterium]
MTIVVDTDLAMDVHLPVRKPAHPEVSANPLDFEPVIPFGSDCKNDLQYYSRMKLLFFDKLIVIVRLFIVHPRLVHVCSDYALGPIAGRLSDFAPLRLAFVQVAGRERVRRFPRRMPRGSYRLCLFQVSCLLVH